MKHAPSLSLKDTGRIYLDHNATTPLLNKVVEQVPHWLAAWGNPSSIHFSGRAPKNLLRESRQHLATLLKCRPLELIFTSGGSESNNLVIKGFAPLAQALGRNEFITTQIEHPSVKESFRALESRGAKVHWLKVSRGGAIDLEAYAQALCDKTALVSIMAANNETGSLMPIKQMAEMAHVVGAKFHTDAVQALGKIEVNLSEWGVDFATFAAHKIYALRGAGLVFSRKGERLTSLISGGNQERGRRAGTENILAITAFGFVADLYNREPIFVERRDQVSALRDQMEKAIATDIGGVQFTGVEVARLPNTSSMVIDNVDGESLLMGLDLAGVSASTGAACSSGNPEPSPTLLAMGLSRREAQGSLRVSLGCDTSREEITEFLVILRNVVDRLRKIRADVKNADAK